ncbi:DUF86 domain-containing protein [Pyrobaculum sp. 3827-6]|uniref:HepT-like ribonuclease domain-containing protein n=1 Tax=Pyrobaculum sp. 3827-6 TaxID=2983604 RepID=UPI0021D952F4|nr:HepT-like ribonuclease domain-containing protein [Pyrobaculum sp. 3827-6]MCU7787575.1 DUF86 domain-containing protein [Pyrobaculum sp. 3827-6]
MKKMIRFRNIVVHQYGAIDVEKVEKILASRGYREELRILTTLHTKLKERGPQIRSDVCEMLAMRHTESAERLLLAYVCVPGAACLYISVLANLVNFNIELWHARLLPWLG